MLGKFDKLIDSGGFLDLFDYPFKRADPQLLESDFVNIASILQHTSETGRDVTSLRFGHSPIIGPCIEHLANALQSPNCTLVKLQFIHNEIGSDGIIKITECLKLNETLTSLEIIDDDIAVCGSRAVAEMLSCNQTLSSLVLQHCGITSGSAIDCITDALGGNSTLRLLE